MKELLLGLLIGPCIVVVVGSIGYLTACAGASRWLTFREWWG